MDIGINVVETFNFYISLFAKALLLCFLFAFLFNEHIEHRTNVPTTAIQSKIDFCGGYKMCNSTFVYANFESKRIAFDSMKSRLKY